MLYFLIGENVWFIAPVTSIQELPWWHLRSWIERAKPSGELPYSSESPRPCRFLHMLGLTCPTEGKVGGDELSSLVLKELHEVTKRHGGLS
jgi:hypothetical protein